MAYNFLTKSVL